MKNELKKIVEKCLKAAGEITAEYYTQDLAVVLKDASSPIFTIADKAAEEASRDVIAKMMPDANIIGEETGITKGSSNVTFVLDGIDGSTAFKSGRPTFMNLIGVTINGVPTVGGMGQPVLGDIIIASADDAFSSSDENKSLAQSILSVTTPEMFIDKRQVEAYEKLTRPVATTLYGGDAYNYFNIAKRRLDLDLAADLRYWDWVAILPIIQAYGGMMTDWQGKSLVTVDPIKENWDETKLEDYTVEVLCARNQDLHTQALEIIKAC